MEEKYKGDTSNAPPTPPLPDLIYSTHLFPGLDNDLRLDRQEFVDDLVQLFHAGAGVYVAVVYAQRKLKCSSSTQAMKRDDCKRSRIAGGNEKRDLNAPSGGVWLGRIFFATR